MFDIAIIYTVSAVVSLLFLSVLGHRLWDQGEDITVVDVILGLIMALVPIMNTVVALFFVLAFVVLALVALSKKILRWADSCVVFRGRQRS